MYDKIERCLGKLLSFADQPVFENRLMRGLQWCFLWFVTILWILFAIGVGPIRLFVSWAATMFKQKK